MKPDHEAAKADCAIVLNHLPCATDAVNLARAYLDLVSREQRAVKLLQRFEKFYGKPTPTLRDDVHDFLTERGEG